jgi:hypothetical protein
LNQGKHFDDIKVRAKDKFHDLLGEGVAGEQEED